MNVLITGGAGFIGSHLAEALLTRGESVVCADNLCLGSKDLLSGCFGNPNFGFAELDVCDAPKLNELFEKHGFDRVYHLAANSDIQKGGGDPSIDFHNTFLTTVSVLDAMRAHNTKRLLFASTSAVYGDKPGLLREDAGDLRPVSYYGAAKLACEAYISAYAAMNGMAANVVRFPNVVGPRLTHGAVFDFAAKLRGNPKELEILGDGKQDKPYIYVSDLIEVMLFLKYETGPRPLGVRKMGTKYKKSTMVPIVGSQVFNVGVDTTTTVRRIADIVCEETGLDGVKYKFTGGSVGWRGDVPKFKYDLSKIHALGWRAKHSSDEAVRLAARALVLFKNGDKNAH